MLAFIKYLLSFFKTDWVFDDYPIRIKRQKRNNPDLGRYKLVTWVATITNWAQMFGGGETKEEALDMLKNRFDEYSQKHNALPRPGVRARLSIAFASAAGINKHRLIARDFFRRVLNRDLETCFVSDKSSVWDFPEADEEIYTRIQQVYGVDVSDVTSGNLVQIFERLSRPETDNDPGLLHGR